MAKVERAVKRVREAERLPLVELAANHAIEQEANFLAFCDAALPKLHDGEDADRVQEMRDAHVRHIDELRGALAASGATALVGHAKATPTGRLASQRLLAITDSVQALRELLHAEEYAAFLYGALAGLDAPEPLARALAACREDGERHVAWLAERTGAPHGA